MRRCTTLTGAGHPGGRRDLPGFRGDHGIPQPLRGLLGTWSLRLAALQERAVTDAGGAPVPLGRLVSPQFAGNPEMFARDHFHPSGAGYERAMAVLLPAHRELDARPRLPPGPPGGDAGNDEAGPGPQTDAVSVAADPARVDQA